VIEGGLAHAEVVGDVAERRPVEAFFAKGTQRGMQDLAAPAVALLPNVGTHGVPRIVGHGTEASRMNLD